MKTFKLVYPHLFTALIFIACTTVPSIRVPQPWIRSLKSSESLQTAAKLKVEVSGNTLPLLGNERLTADQIHEKLSYLLRRRGFSLTDHQPDYTVHLSYKTDRNDRF